MRLEERATKVTIDHGVEVHAFWNPPHSARPSGAPIKRWRVRLPAWFPKGSWLHGRHSFATLEDALAALDETGALDAIGAYRRAARELANVRGDAFGKIMSAYTRSERHQ